MDWFADNALYLIVGLGVAAIGLIVGWFQTTDRRLLYGSSLPILLAGGVLVLDQVYESPAQQVERRLYEIAAMIEQDDVEGTVNAFVPEATDERVAVRQWFRVAEIRNISIKNNLKIEVARSGRRATAEFNVTADFQGKGRRGAGFRGKRPFFFVVHFERDRDTWLIDSYEYYSAEKGFQKRSAR